MSENINPLGIHPIEGQDKAKTRLVTVGSILAALAASTCCIVPLLLFSLGISGAWIGQLTALEPYKPIFITITLGFLGYGYWLVYKQSQVKCDDDQACARPMPNYLVMGGLILATILVALSIAWPYIVPLLLS
ncbi:mercuric transporter MerT family protein [Maritalea sp. S77]|uniref:mercuric transporter MerT family protein n=1 Tax=Maritalea sp. S77 TaxID=3415125 RepID=UPI003C7E8BD5